MGGCLSIFAPSKNPLPRLKNHLEIEYLQRVYYFFAQLKRELQKETK